MDELEVGKMAGRIEEMQNEIKLLKDIIRYLTERVLDCVEKKVKP